jgi:Helitron helicase-like domain at N-terminus
MYLLYDVIQRRKSALGNSLLVKRGDYQVVQDVISSLTHQQLIAAAQSLRLTQTTSDPAIATLRQAIQTVAARVPNSFAQKLEMRLHIRGLFIEFGPAAFWLTLNPSDLRDPLVVKLAGITLHCLTMTDWEGPGDDGAVRGYGTAGGTDVNLELRMLSVCRCYGKDVHISIIFMPKPSAHPGPARLARAFQCIIHYAGKNHSVAQVSRSVHGQPRALLHCCLARLLLVHFPITIMSLRERIRPS